MRTRHKGVPSAEQLAALPLFAGCTSAELTRLDGLAERVSVPAGWVLIRENERTSEFYVLISGAAAVTRGGGHLADLGPGDCCGELALLDPAPRNATVTMSSDGTVLVLGPREFAALLEQLPAFSRRLLNRLAKRLHVLDGPSR